MHNISDFIQTTKYYTYNVKYNFILKRYGLKENPTLIQPNNNKKTTQLLFSCIIIELFSIKMT